MIMIRAVLLTLTALLVAGAVLFIGLRWITLIGLWAKELL